MNEPRKSNRLICDERDATEMIYTIFQKVMLCIYYNNYIYTIDFFRGGGHAV